MVVFSQCFGRPPSQPLEQRNSPPTTSYAASKHLNPPPLGPSSKPLEQAVDVPQASRCFDSLLPARNLLSLSPSWANA